MYAIARNACVRAITLAQMETLLGYFRRVDDGKWICVKSNDFKGPAGRVQIIAGTEFAIGNNYMGVDVALELESATRKERMAVRDKTLPEDYRASSISGSPDSFQR